MYYENPGQPFIIKCKVDCRNKTNFKRSSLVPQLKIKKIQNKNEYQWSIIMIMGVSVA